MRKQLKFAAIAGAVAAPLAATATAVPATAVPATAVPATAVPATAVPATAAPAGGDPGASSAYGIAAEGLVPIPPTPEVTSESRPFTRSVVSIPGNPFVRLSVLRTRAVSGHAEASVVDLKIAKAAISPDAVLTAKLISARCDDGLGLSRLVDVRLAGRAIQAGASPNSRVTVPVAGVGGVQVTVNKQVRNPDGSITVTGLELAVQALGHSQTVDVSSATCAGGEAPRPHPVPSDLPVTG
jgi:hypothetical protein